MDSSSAEAWTGRAPGSVGGPATAPDGLTSWDSGSAGQDSYREPTYQPLPYQRSSASRVSRWSDAPPGQAVGQDATPGAEDRPSPAGLEPPYKKVRNDSQGVPGQGGADYRDDPGASYGGDSGQGDGPPGLAYGRSGTSSTGPQNYAGAGAQGYGSGYGAQQMPAYGSNQNYGSQHLAPQSAPVSFAPGSARGTGALFYKTKLCTKFKSGACTFNERCHFAHGVEELRKPPPGWEDMVSSAGGTTTGIGGKPAGGLFMGGSGRNFDGQPRRTKICRYFLEGNCPYGERCNFLHTEDAQKTTGMEPSGAANFGAGRGGMKGPTVSRQNYKTRLCAKWEKGEPCDFGDKCHFAHGPAELQSFTGVASYPNGGPVVADAQYSGVGPEVVAPKMYADPSVMNPPPLTVPYGVPVDTTSTGGAGPVAASNLNPYPSSGTTVVPYASTQPGVNGVSTNYNYWDEEKKWEGAGMAPSQPTAPTQGYVQPNQTTPWMTNYMGDGGYPRRENDPAISQYPQEQPQQQQSTAFYTGGPVHEYQDPKQGVNPTYVQDDSQNKYQGEVRNGDGGYYQSAYNVPNYSTQQADYSARYNMAEAWGGKM